MSTIMATMDDQTLIKAFLKKQKEIQDEFLEQLKEFKAPVETRELERLLAVYKATAQNIANVKPELDTSNLETTIKKSINFALNNSSLAKLADEVDTQTRAVERSNSILENGTGWRLKWWLLLLTTCFGFLVGWGINWYFEIPAQIAGNVKNEQLLKNYRYGLSEGDDFVKFINSSCKLKKQYAVFSNQSIECNNMWLSPLRHISKE